MVERLGRNRGCYCGETIQIAEVLARSRQAALKAGWQARTFCEADGFCLEAWERRGPEGGARVYVSSGIHGDEPAGPIALAELLEEDAWPSGMNFWVCPCLNPGGFTANRRENLRGIDLNREYRAPVAEEIRAHRAWLEEAPSFDFALLLHEDWEASGFYVYDLNPRGLPSPAEAVVQAVVPVCPIETSTLIDHWPALDGIIRPQVHPEERPQWAEAVYLVAHKSPQSLTLEAPSDYPLAVRVAALRRAVAAALCWIARTQPGGSV